MKLSGAGRKAAAPKGGAGKKRTGSLWADADEDESPERVQQPRKAVDAQVLLEDNDDDAEKRRRVSAVQAPAAPKLNHKQIAELLSSVIKLSTSNKIDQDNCWTLQLTENLSGVLESNSSNFQVAASALDASTKIYAARVDSVHQESFKVLSGLNRTDADKGAKGDANSDGSQADEARAAAPVKRRAARLTSTLVKSEDEINDTARDLQYEEDPLVRKATAAFESGGARGLLLNQLGVFGGVTLVFDSSDVPAEADFAAEPPNLMLRDTSDLRDHFARVLGGLDTLFICPEVSSFQDTGVVHRDDGTAAQLASVPLDFIDAAPESHYNAQSQPSQQLPGPDMVPYDGGGDDDNDYGDDAGHDDDDLEDQPREFDADGNIVASPQAALVEVRSNNNAAAPSSRGGALLVQQRPGAVSNSPARITDDLVRACGVGVVMGVAADAFPMVGAAGNGWAGPERMNWPFRKVTAKGVTVASAAAAGDDAAAADVPAGDAAAGVAGAKQGRKKKAAGEAFFIDFTQPAGEDWEKAFAPPKRGGTKLSQMQKERARATTTVLPPDLHYGTRDLMALFTKPKWLIPRHQLNWKPIVDATAQGQTVLTALMDDGDAPAAGATAWFDNNHGAGAGAADDGEPQLMDVDGDQLHHFGDDDGDDDNGAGGDYGGGYMAYDPQQQQPQQPSSQPLSQQPASASLGVDGYDDGSQRLMSVVELTDVQRAQLLVPEPQRVEHIQLGFVRVAKAVNVKALKACIWRVVATATAPGEAGAPARPVPPPQPQSFQDMLNTLPRSLPRFETSNVSVPFCFISLLHLANENGLELGNENMGHLTIAPLIK